MTATYLGSLSVGAINIGVGLALPGLAAAIAPVATLQATLAQQVVALAAAQVSLGDPTAMLAQITAAIAALEAGFATSVAGSVSAIGSVQIDLAAQAAVLLTLVNATNALIATLNAAIAAGGIHAYKLEGKVSELSNDLASQIAGGLPGGGGSGAPANALVLVTESPSAWTGLSVVVKTS